MNEKDYSLFDDLIEGIQVISKEYIYIYVNDTLARQLGVTKESMIGKSILERFPNLKEHPVYLRIQQCMTERIVGEYSRVFRLPDGSTRWAEIKTQPFETGLLIMSTDITKRKEAELSIQEKDTYYRHFFEQLQEGFILQKAIKDAEGKVINFRVEEINNTAAQAIGQPIERLIGALRTAIFGPLEGRLLEIANRVVVDKETAKFIEFYPAINRWVQVNAYSPMPDYLAAFFTDVTQLKEYEQQLAKLNQELEFLVNSRTLELVEALERAKKINTIKSNFLSMTTHELNTPLASIKLCVGVLEKLNTAPNIAERKEYHDYIKEEVGNLLTMLGSFADTAPLVKETSQELLDLPLLMYRLTKELKGMCQTEQTIHYEHKGHQLLQLDKTILRRILINLLANAIKYSSKDIIIQTKAKKRTLRIKISDEGIGIPKLEQAQLFTKFFRATNATNVQGTGLGLHIVKNYVELMNGTIKFKSKEKEGTTFTVTVPVTMLS